MYTKLWTKKLVQWEPNLMAIDDRNSTKMTIKSKYKNQGLLSATYSYGDSKHTNCTQEECKDKIQSTKPYFN